MERAQVTSSLQHSNMKMYYDIDSSIVRQNTSKNSGEKKVTRNWKRIDTLG